MKWKTLEHNGVVFPPEYEPRGLRARIGGKRVELSPLAEEMAFAWAKKIGTPYVEDPVFCENFLKDFSPHLPEEHRGVRIEEIDFVEFLRVIEEEKKRKLDKEYRKRLARERKEKREALKERHGWAELDGERTEAGNYVIEPSGIFMGRGKHPLRGRWKPRVLPREVTLNLGRDAPVPEGEWKIVHNRNSTWLASWVEELTKTRKYVWLADVSPIKQKADKAKYDEAARLGPNIERVRKHIVKGLGRRRVRERKVATVCYLVDRLLMRVGDEKDENEADTVGASTLRVEHIAFDDEGVHFDFLGKDSVRWRKSIPDPHPKALENLKRFVAGKAPGDEVFDGVGSTDVNDFFGRAMKGLTAKVFRTYFATRFVEDYLREHDGFPEGTTEFLKVYHAKMANARAAEECNHQRTPPKTWESSLEKKRARLKKAKKKAKKKAAGTKKESARLKARREKIERQIDLHVKTKELNLGTALRNYIDPRIFKSWADHVGLDWKKIYTQSLQRKFLWAAKSRRRWKPKKRRRPKPAADPSAVKEEAARVGGEKNE